MFKKISWIVALLAALSLAVVFVGCGPEPEEPPPPEFEKGDVLFDLADWLDEKSFGADDVLNDTMDLDPIMLAGSPTITVTNKGGLRITDRAQGYYTIDLKMEDFKPYFVSYLFELEVVCSGNPANGYKVCMPDPPYSELAKSEADATKVTLTWTVTPDYPQAKVRVQPTTADTQNFTIESLTLTYQGPREK